jgi:hypothetical protein
VRGDSLRDLYAKSLALLGLAALAGVGALVDYWPADLALPRDIARALPVPASPSGIRLPDRDTLTLAAIQPDRPAPRPSARLAFVEPAAVLAPSDVVAVLTAPPAPALDVAPLQIASLSLTEVELLLPPPPAIAVTDLEPAVSVAQAIPLAAPVEAEPVDSSPMQMLTGALRRTGQSIVQGGAKTGETIVGAFKGAFRKVPWFNLGPASRPIV